MKWISLGIVLLLLLAWLADTPASTPNGMPIEVFKSPTCGCCAKWIGIVRGATFAPTVNNSFAVDEVKERHQVPRQLRSCHTTLAGGYVFEGHVPPDLIAKVLREKPAIAGLAVPGMPLGSPGMEQAGRKQPYDVFAFTANGMQSVYARR